MWISAIDIEFANIRLFSSFHSLMKFANIIFVQFQVALHDIFLSSYPPVQIFSSSAKQAALTHKSTYYDVPNMNMLTLDEREPLVKRKWSLSPARRVQAEGGLIKQI